MVKPNDANAEFRLGWGHKIHVNDVFYNKWSIHMNDVEATARLHKSTTVAGRHSFWLACMTEDDQTQFRCTFVIDTEEKLLYPAAVRGLYRGLVHSSDFEFEWSSNTLGFSKFGYEHDRLVDEEAIPILKIMLGYMYDQDFTDYTLANRHYRGPKTAASSEHYRAFFKDADFPTEIITNENCVFRFG
jgi:hypothetical protein